MRSCQITGWGTYLPSDVVRFAEQTRYRVDPEMRHLDMLTIAGQKALAKAGLEPERIDCVIAAVAAGVQPIPCTAALVMEQLAPRAAAAALDINTTCTSFITALDIASRYLDAGEYRNVLVVSGDVASRFLNPEQRESFELFSDAAAAFVVSAADRDPQGPGVISSLQQTWPEYAHVTELRGGLSLHPSQSYASGDPRDYLFDMDGRGALFSMLAILPGFFERFFERAGLTVADFAAVVPHQASPALGMVMRRLQIPDDKFIDNVAEYGNMVSAAVPFTLARALKAGRLHTGDQVMLCGTAAGLTANALALRL